MTSVLVRDTQEEEEPATEEGSRRQSDAAASQGMPGAPRSWEGQGHSYNSSFSSCPDEENGSRMTPAKRLWESQEPDSYAALANLPPLG